MKRSIALLVTVALLLATLPLSLTSCSQTSRLLRMDEEERAERFYRTVIGNSGSASSGSFEQTMIMKMDINGISMEQTSEATVTFVTERNDLTHLEQVKTTVITDGISREIYEDRGFANGEMFLYSKEGGVEIGMKSSIATQDYNAFLGELSTDDTEIRVGEGFCETVTCVQNSDKTWTATYEDFTEEGMEPFLEMLAGIEYLVTAEHKLTDVRFTYEADDRLYPAEARIEFLFEEDPTAQSAVPEISVRTVYRGWNRTTLSQPYDTSDFTEVEDARWVDRFLCSLQDRETATEGRFTVKNETEARYIGGGTNRSEMTGRMTFKNRDGMEVSLEYDQDGYRYDMDFSDGSLRLVVRDTETGKKVVDETQPMTDGDAQSLVSQYMNSESIALADLADVTLRDSDKNVYRFTLSDAVGNSLREIYEYELDGEMTDFNGYIDATVEDGVLQSYTYHVFASFRVEKKYTLYLNVDLTVTFEQYAEGGEEV